MENTDGARLTFAFENGVHGPGELLVVSKGTSPSSGESDLGSVFNSSHMSKHDGFISSFFSKSNDNVNAKVELQQNFWELKDAFLETGLQYKLVSHFIFFTYVRIFDFKECALLGFKFGCRKSQRLPTHQMGYLQVLENAPLDLISARVL